MALVGIEPTASALSRQHSTVELQSQNGSSAGDPSLQPQGPIHRAIIPHEGTPSWSRTNFDRRSGAPGYKAVAEPSALGAFSPPGKNRTCCDPPIERVPNHRASGGWNGAKESNPRPASASPARVELAASAVGKRRPSYWTSGTWGDWRESNPAHTWSTARPLTVSVQPPWSEWRELNPRELGPKPSGQPLSHTPVGLAGIEPAASRPPAERATDAPQSVS